MKPLFLDCPPRYTRTQRQTTNDVDYACALEQHRDSNYSPVWWVVTLVLCVVAALVIITGMPS